MNKIARRERPMRCFEVNLEATFCAQLIAATKKRGRSGMVWSPGSRASSHDARKYAILKLQYGSQMGPVFIRPSAAEATVLPASAPATAD
jgi:hypothetical protein